MSHQDQDISSVHTNSLTYLLNQLGFSLAITTYQAGKLILARADGDATNTHFRMFSKPMGLAVGANRLALGVAAQIWDFRNIPAAAQKIEPPGKHDALYLPRAMAVTGDIDIHEMAWAGDELWFINTKFSCLCTLNPDYSFVPRWTPPFISAYDMRDRCHLNGLALRDGRPRYITALGETDEPGGWRANKAAGGILMDIDNNEYLARGLSMPHSPRWYRDRLWFLESGRGTLNYLDPNTGENIKVAELPGFTRGLDFAGDLAIIGLSQVRETAVFAGLPLTRTQPVRHCGVWLVDIRNGQTVAFLRFERGVQEVFAVAALPHRFPELIADSLPLMATNYVLPDEALKKTIQPQSNWEFAETHLEQGNSLVNSGQYEPALAAFRKALSLRPDLLPARFNLAIALGQLGKQDEAIDELQQVLKEDVGHVEAMNALGFAYGRIGQPEKAADYFRQAVTIRPEYHQARNNLALTELQIGCYADGWKHLAECESASTSNEAAGLKAWNGSPGEDIDVLILAEQPLENLLRFARFVSLAAERCRSLVLACPESSHAIMQRVFAASTNVVIGNKAGAQQCNHFAHLMSLPKLLEVGNQLPCDIGRSQPQPSHIEGKRRLRVGLVSSLKGDGQPRPDFWQTLPKLSAIDYSLLLDSPATETGSQLMPQVYLAQDAHTVAKLSGFDLIIGQDGWITELAALMGQEVWLMPEAYANWRNASVNGYSPWYPQIKIFASGQTANEVQNTLRDALATWDKHHEQT